MEQWWRSVPLVTRYLFAASFFLTLACHFGFLSAGNFILNWNAVFYEFQIWRLVTCFFIHGLGMKFLMNMVFLFKYSSSLEETWFSGRTSDYVWFLTFGCTLIVAVAVWMGWAVVGTALVLMIVYYWSRKNPNIPMSMWFGIQFQSVYFPWVLCLFNLLMGGTPILQLLGIAVGHVFFFLEDVYPRTSGVRLLKTPQLFYSIIPPEYNSNSARMQAQRFQRADTGTRFTGTGRRLGDE